MDYFFCILKNETPDDHLGWIKACEDSKFDIRFKIIEFTKNDWLENILSEDFSFILARPPGQTSWFKQLYDERISILYQFFGERIYPSLEEILIYENKRMLAYWLKANKIPHPETWIFYHKDEAMDFVRFCPLPIVAKTAIGGSGSGVSIINNRSKLATYIKRAFSNQGIVRRRGPNLRRGNKVERFVKRIRNMPDSYGYFKNKFMAASIDPQRWFVILQEYYKLEFEWRTVRIGDSYFAHKKLPTHGELISGTSKVSWDEPSESLLNFIKTVCDKKKFLSQAIDIFEPEPDRFLVNELQCFFGSQNPHQMIVNGNPGKYILKSSQWVFEKGIFNTNNSFDIRLQHVLSILNSKEVD